MGFEGDDLSKSERQLKQQLATLFRTLPPGSLLQVNIEPGQMWIEKLLLPPSARKGGGSRLLSRILSHADRAGVVTSLCANPTQRAGDPGEYDLARWYHSFGFRVLGRGPEGVLMERTPKPVQSPENLVSQAKTAPRMSLEEYEDWQPKVSRPPTF